MILSTLTGTYCDGITKYIKLFKQIYGMFKLFYVFIGYVYVCVIAFVCPFKSSVLISGKLQSEMSTILIFKITILILIFKNTMIG